VNSLTGKNINCSLKLRKFLRYFRFFVPVKGLSIILAFWRLFDDQEIKECLCSFFKSEPPQNIQRATQNIQRALTENYFPFVFTSESGIDHEGFENHH